MAWIKKTTKKQVEQEEDTAHIAQELYSKNVELARTNRTLSLLRTIDGLVLDSNNTIDQLAEGVAQAVVENAGFLFSLVFVGEGEGQNITHFTAKGVAINQASQKQDLEQSLHNLKVELSMQSRWFSPKEACMVFSVSSLSDDMVQELFGRQEVAFRNIMSLTGTHLVCTIKLIAQGSFHGFILIGLPDDQSEVKVEQLEQLGRIGEATGIALDNKLLTLKYEEVLKKLRSNNEKLKALDEAKDEFVSMASHQLRTPLTSIKGYVSMVLEGDAGDINDTQKQMLGQAMFSSQRMVYLIADLLNVSRLKTGKFVIEAKPVFLPDLVDQELSQLHEGAAAKNLTLNFTKPEAFPTLQLDDTKIRQVVMNFTDNAIYYTPAGGTIDISLVEKDTHIEFLVKDSGIGVPKTEQHKLFSKFYRAENARKARPDGTGLGLFMAKKIIIAQGGALIFNSVEGKGSTFGFRFNKDGTPLSKPEDDRDDTDAELVDDTPDDPVVTNPIQ